MAKLRYYASTDSLGFVIPSTLRGYKKDPCICGLVEILGNPDIPEEDLEFQRFHPNKLHYFYQVKGTCCDIVPNSLIASTVRPKGKYREWINIPFLFSQTVTDTFFADNCDPGDEDITGTEYSKTYKAVSQEALDAEVLADSSNFEDEGQAAANAADNCEPEA